MESQSQTNAAEFTVSEISGALKRMVEDTFGYVRVRGEITGYRGPHSSGHAYFALKDERSRLEAVIWKGAFSKLQFKPEEGLEVVATGRMTTYPGSSKYQIVIDRLEPAGAGALMALLEERKRKLTAEGLFDEARKQLLPFMPRVIGVVTSPTGAVIRDIIHRIADRFPLHVLVWPVRVQGETSGNEVATAIAGFNALDASGAIPRPDVIIVARGGGSLEDLWGFNDEVVVRAAAASDIPLISAVGHETDWTLIDHAADVRAPTPTGAAELAVPVKAELDARLANLHARLRGALSRHLDRRRDALRSAARALPRADELLALPRRRLDDAGTSLGRVLAGYAGAKRSAFSVLAARLSPRTLDHMLANAANSANQAGTSLARAMRDRLLARRNRLDRLRLSPAMPTRLAGESRRRLIVAGAGLQRLFARSVTERRARLDGAARLADSLSFKATLERGFAIVRDAKGHAVSLASQLSPGDDMSVQFRDGAIAARAAGPADPANAAQSRKAAPKTGKPAGGGQGSLF